jgi:hypothetical protein
MAAIEEASHPLLAAQEAYIEQKDRYVILLSALHQCLTCIALVYSVDWAPRNHYYLIFNYSIKIFG